MRPFRPAVLETASHALPNGIAAWSTFSDALNLSNQTEWLSGPTVRDPSIAPTTALESGRPR